MQVNLTWNAVAGALFYRVYRSTNEADNFQLIGQSNPASGEAVASYLDGNLPDGLTFFYKISAVGVDGEGPWSTTPFTASAPAALSAPTGLVGVIT